jgi:hypothetical protein
MRIRVLYLANFDFKCRLAEEEACAESHMNSEAALYLAELRVEKQLELRTR